MNKDLIPIITTYWGAKCGFLAGGGRPIVSSLDWPELRYLGTKYVQNFKIHLRNLSDITEEELVELGYDKLSKNEIYSAEEKNRFATRILQNKVSLTVKEINFLRSKGFCVDQKLIDANLVTFIKP